MTEFELKLQVPPARAKAVEAALRRGTVETTPLKARYFDTPDRALARHGVVLRLRQEGRQWVQTAKAPGRHGFERLEHNVPVSSGEAAPDAGRHEGHPVAKPLREALAASGQALQLLFETDITRLTRTVEAGGSAVEIAFDRGEIRAGQRRVPVLEVEFERKDGSALATIELAQRWCEQHGLWLDPLSKAELGHRLATGEDTPAPVLAPPVVQQPQTAFDLLADALGSALHQVLGNARELVAGSGGDEHIHQLRVGLRRLRAMLREVSGVEGLPPWPASLDPALRALFDVLGQHRDRSTLLPALRDRLREAGGPDAAWDAPLPEVAEAVRQAALQSALLQLAGLVQQLHETPASAGPSLQRLRKQMRRRLRKLHDQVRRDGSRFVALQEADRHRVRKRLKRLRYLAEGMRPLFDRDDVDRYVKKLKVLQDALGEYQDASAGRALYTRRAAVDPSAWFGAGWLAAREQELAAACERACRKAPGFARYFGH